MSGGSERDQVAEVIVFAPLRQTFDYLLPVDSEAVPVAGARVWVPFGRGHRVGVVARLKPAVAAHQIKLKAIDLVLDQLPLITDSVLEMARWAARYYQHPIGEVLALSFPTWLRRKRELPGRETLSWYLTASGAAVLRDGRVRGVRQADILSLLRPEQGTTEAALAALGSNWRQPMMRLERHGLVRHEAVPPMLETISLEGAGGFELNSEQRAAVRAVVDDGVTRRPFLLNGVTGSGKTEVYFELIVNTLREGGQALVLVPEITLTKQLIQRFRDRFGSGVELLHSGLTDRQRVEIWDRARCGEIPVLIGTRSAVWAPLPALKLIVVDEEHDTSYKQQEGFRYSARDLAIVRADYARCKIVLGSATPSLESLANVGRGKFAEIKLTKRPKAIALPVIELVDIRGQRLEAGLSSALLKAMAAHLGRGEQVMLFLNRRGYAPMLVCRACGELRKCPSCDAYLVYHKQARRLRCHHCDREWPQHISAGCCADETPEILGQGTEQLEETVISQFPERRICRIDRDTMAGKGKLEEVLERIAARDYDIIVGTQMVTKGLDFSGIGLVGVVDTDGRLFSIDFRSEERLAQLLIQVAGRAGRADLQGRVMVQTYQPNNPVLRRILDDGYMAYAWTATAERQQVGLPPYAAMVILRAESSRAERPLAFLQAVRSALVDMGPESVELGFPIPALMERRAGRTRALLSLKSSNRGALHEMLGDSIEMIEQQAKHHRVRWTVDVDPLETL